ncbi:MAG: ABC transporter ATP-binding protein [Holophaga sp.]|nr:ABC transporter ATP-binding protein [Holophaga sp.]
MTLPPAEPLAIRLQSCAKTFDNGVRALEPMDLAIEAGETLVLLGPSGCGKTTTLRLIAGLEHPDAGGKVLFDDRDVTRESIEKRNVGMVFQSYALFPNMTVAENVGYGLRIRSVPARELRARVSEMLSMMRIEALADRRVDQISGGQRQRVALARALAVEPRALLLDEPLTSLDAKLRETLRVEINMLLRRLGITTIYVTHDQTEAMALGDRIIVMSRGRVAQTGTPREIYHQPASAFVADFIGTMNRLQGEMRGRRFVCASGTLNWTGQRDDIRELLFRPEDVRIAEDAEAADLSGTITAAFFIGDRTRLFIDVSEGQPLVIESPARCTLQVGQPVRLQVDSKGLLAL